MTRKASTTTDSKRSLRTLILFCGIVFLVIAFSLSAKLFTLLKNSSFDGNNLYVVSFIHDNDVDVVGFYPEGKKITHLSISQTQGKTDVVGSLGILVDGTVTVTEEFSSAKSAAKLLQDAALFKRNAKGDFSAVDMIRLSFFARTLPPGNIETEEVQLPLDSVRSNELVRELFSDQKLLKENLTVQIVNGTNISGLGKKMEMLLLNRAVGVISVINSDTKEKVSRVEYTGEKSYTLDKMSQLLQVEPVLLDEKKLADIILVIGEDRADLFK